MFSAENREKGSLYKGLVRVLARRIFVGEGQRRLRVRLRNGNTTEFFQFGVTALRQELKCVHVQQSILSPSFP